MVRRSSRYGASRFVVGLLVVLVMPQTAVAWPGHGGWVSPRGAPCVMGPRTWCGPGIGPRGHGVWGGWGGGWSAGWCGSSRWFGADSISIAGPWGRFFSGTVGGCAVVPRPCVPGWYGRSAWCGPSWYGGSWYTPGWCAPAWSPPVWGGGCWVPRPVYPFWYGGYGGGVGCSPVIFSPFGGAIAPTFGPAGVLPFMGLSASAAPQFDASAAATLLRQPLVATRSGGAPGAKPQAVAVRVSNGLTRLRAARVVAIGDRHLRAAVQTPGDLHAALDAYRRAATIAPDLVDTFLRQAIVLTALERDADAARAVDKAVAIDGRLGADAAAVASDERRPADPVFGDRPDGKALTLAARTDDLLSGIFGANRGPAAGQVPAARNWIAARWARHLGGPPQPEGGDVASVR